MTYYIENESYTLSKGDILIIPPLKIHRPVIETSQTPMTVMFSGFTMLTAPSMTESGIFLI